MTILNQFKIQTGVGQSDGIFIQDTAGDLRISYAVVVTGTVTYTVQHSLGDDVFINNTDVQGATAHEDGNYIFPVQQVRVDVTAGTGTAKLFVMQHIR